MWDSGDTTPRNESSPETVPALDNLPPPSPVVMRYWRQCAGAEEEDPAVFTLMMRIQSVITADQGTYYCHANNSLGEVSRPVQLQVSYHSCQAVQVEK